MKYEKCKGCKYCKMKWPKDKYGRFLKGVHACVCKPYWLKPIENIAKCPKVEYGATFDSYSLICKVNEEV